MNEQERDEDTVRRFAGQIVDAAAALDLEIDRLERTGDLLPCSRFNFWHRAWQCGVYDARRVMADNLRRIRNGLV